MSLDKFWSDVTENALRVIVATPKENPLGFWQPGWVGPDYEPGKGVVIIMQNPGSGGMNNSDEDSDENRFQKALNEIWTEPTVPNYQAYTKEVMRQMPDWKPWKIFVRPFLEGIGLQLEQVAWLNAVKYRTVVKGKKDKVDWNARQFNSHINEFLFSELDLLKPAGVVSYGRYARTAIDKYQKKTHHVFAREHTPQRGEGPRADAASLAGRSLSHNIEQSKQI